MINFPFSSFKPSLIHYEQELLPKQIRSLFPLALAFGPFTAQKNLLLADILDHQQIHLWSKANITVLLLFFLRVIFLFNYQVLLQDGFSTEPHRAIFFFFHRAILMKIYNFVNLWPCKYNSKCHN